MAGKCSLGLLNLPSCPGRLGGGRDTQGVEEILNKVSKERLDPEIQPFITLSSTNF